ncbi:PF07600 domain protein, partial [Leptospira interrogans str. HAI1594]
LRSKLPFLLRKYSKQIASMKRLHDRAGKIKYNRGVGKMKKFSVRVHTGVWVTLGVLAAAHGVSRCYLLIICSGWRILVEKKIFL